MCGGRSPCSARSMDSSNTTSTAPSALKIESIGTFALRDVTLVAGSRTLLADLDSSLTGGDRFVVSRLHGRSDDSELQASGELSSVARRTGTFTVDAPSLDLDGLMAFLAAATPAGARQSPPPEGTRAPPVAGVPLHLDIALRARKGRALGIAFTNLETTGRMRGGAVSLEDLKMEALRRPLRWICRVRWVASANLATTGAASSTISTCPRSWRLPVLRDR